MGGVTTWYALAETFSAFKYYLPMSGDCWSLGSFAGMNRPQQTADYLAVEYIYNALPFFFPADPQKDTAL